MFNLILDSAAGLTTEPQGADNSSINVFSLAAAPPVCIKIVFSFDTNAVFFLHLNYRGQGVGCAHTKTLAMPWVSPWPVTTLRTGWILSHREEGHSQNNSASSSHSWSSLYCWLSQSYKTNTLSSPSLGALCGHEANRMTATVSSIRVPTPCGCMSPDMAI